MVATGFARAVICETSISEIGLIDLSHDGDHKIARTTITIRGVTIPLITGS